VTSITGTQLTFTAPLPAHNGTPTSRAAAERIEPVAGTLRRQVLDYLREQGEHGATDEEMQDALHMNPSTQRPRRIELCDTGWILRTDDVRKTHSGRDAAVYRVAPSEQGDAPVIVEVAR
jgi:hypothetical protein